MSGFLFCADCGSKMKLNGCLSHGKMRYSYNCGDHFRYGKSICFSHYIPAKTIEDIVLDDIREMAQRIVIDEKAIREEFIRKNEELADKAIKVAQKELQGKSKRKEELSRLIQIAYEDRLKGKMPEDICIDFILECPPFDSLLGLQTSILLYQKEFFYSKIISLTFFEPRVQHGVFSIQKTAGT